MNFSRLSCRILRNAVTARERFAERTFSCDVRQAMRFVQYRDGSGRRGLGVQSTDGCQIISLSDADPTVPADMVSFLHDKRSVEKAKKWVTCPVVYLSIVAKRSMSIKLIFLSSHRLLEEKNAVLQSSEVELLPCVTKPDKVRLLRTRLFLYVRISIYFLVFPGHMCRTELQRTLRRAKQALSERSIFFF